MSAEFMVKMDDIAEGRKNEGRFGINMRPITKNGRTQSGRDADELCAAILESKTFKSLRVRFYTHGVGYAEIANMLMFDPPLETLVVESKATGRYAWSRETHLPHIFSALSNNTHLRKILVEGIKLQLSFLQVLVKSLSNHFSHPKGGSLTGLSFDGVYDIDNVDPVHGSGLGAVAELLALTPNKITEFSALDYPVGEYESIQFARMCLYSNSLHSIAFRGSKSQAHHPNFIPLITSALRETHSQVIYFENCSFEKTEGDTGGKKIDTTEFILTARVNYPLLEKVKAEKPLQVLFPEISYVSTLLSGRTPLVNSLQRLVLANAGLKDSDAPAIADFIAKSNALQELNLSMNQFTDCGAAVIANVLPTASLISFSFAHNRLSAKGVSALLHSLRINHTITKFKIFPEDFVKSSRNLAVDASSGRKFCAGAVNWYEKICRRNMIVGKTLFSRLYDAFFTPKPQTPQISETHKSPENTPAKPTRVKRQRENHYALA